MKSVFNNNVREELLQRINLMSDQHQAQWAR